MVSIRNRSGGVDTKGSCIFSEVDVKFFPFHATNVAIKYSRELLNCQALVKSYVHNKGCRGDSGSTGYKTDISTGTG